MQYHDILIFTLKLFLLFMIGTMLGWVVELFWRRFFGLAKRWMNPGFLNGPWLPLYGFGTIILYFICRIQISILFKSIIFLFGLTLLEYITGTFFVKIYNLRLWDYSEKKLNIKGIICPFYSILWTIMGLFFYYLIYPRLQDDINKLLTHLELSFFIGIYVGIFVIDIFQSFSLANKIRAVIKESNYKWHVNFENFKLEIRDRIKTRPMNEVKLLKVTSRSHFLLPFNGESLFSIREGLKTHRVNSKLKKKLKNN